MKIVFFTTCFLLCFTSGFQLTENSAKSVLRSKHGDNKDEYVENSVLSKVTKVQNKWSSVCKFGGVHKWQEFNNELKQTGLPTKEIIENEKCVSKCKDLDANGDRRGEYEEWMEDAVRYPELIPWFPACNGELGHNHCFNVGLKTFKKVNNFKFGRHCTPEYFLEYKTWRESQDWTDESEDEYYESSDYSQYFK